MSTTTNTEAPTIESASARTDTDVPSGRQAIVRNRLLTSVAVSAAIHPPSARAGIVESLRLQYLRTALARWPALSPARLHRSSAALARDALALAQVLAPVTWVQAQEQDAPITTAELRRKVAAAVAEARAAMAEKPSQVATVLAAVADAPAEAEGADVVADG